MRTSKWRQHCAPIIATILAENAKEKVNVKRKALRMAYPYGERKNHPYKIWRDEIRKQMGISKKLTTTEIHPNQLEIPFTL